MTYSRNVHPASPPRNINRSASMRQSYLDGVQLHTPVESRGREKALVRRCCGPCGRKIDPASNDRAVTIRHFDLFAGIKCRNFLVGIERGVIVRIEVRQQKSVGPSAFASADVPMKRTTPFEAMQYRRHSVGGMAENFDAMRRVYEGAVHKKRKHGFAHDCILAMRSEIVNASPVTENLSHAQIPRDCCDRPRGTMVAEARKCW